MRLRRIISAGLWLALAGCAPTSAPVPGQPEVAAAPRGARVSEPMLTCLQATRAAGQALSRMGYSISSVETAKAGAPGRIVATRDTGWAPADPEGGAVYTVTVIVTCSDSGSDFEAFTDEGLATRLRFPQQFALALKAEAGRTKTGPKATAEPQGLVLAVEPQRAAAAQGTFGADLPSAGITPVMIMITNRSKRRYEFRRAEVELVTVEGTRTSPLPLSDATARIAKLSDAAAVQKRMGESELQDGAIAAGASLEGYLYFNAAAYQRARIVLIDVESDEPEGFSVEF